MKNKRKSPTFKELLICEKCGKKTKRTGPVQKYCKTCSEEENKLRKKRWYIKNNPDAYSTKEKRYCDVCGSNYKVCSFKGKGNYCQKHFHQMYRYGYTYKGNKKRRQNRYLMKGKKTIIYTEKNEKIIIDTEDLSKIKNHYWSIVNGYAITCINHKHVKMTLFLLGKTKNKVIDHKNGNKLDNRKSNLRKTTTQMNAFNASLAKNNESGTTGVSKVKRKTKTKWRARIMKNRKEINLGCYDTIEEAIDARKKGEIKYFGENILCQTK